MKNYTLIAAVVALALTLAFIVRFVGPKEMARPKPSMPGKPTESAGKPEKNTVSRQGVRIPEPQNSVQSVEIK